MHRWDDGSPEPNVVGEFTRWVPWSARKDLEVSRGDYIHAYGGVYLIAHYDRAPPVGPADVLDDAVVYVGEGGNLGRRWYQFERSSSKELSAHSGGFSHRYWREESGVAWETTHVAAFPIWFASEGDTDKSSSLARRFRLYLEQLVLWRIVCHRQGRDLTLLNAK